jgi:lipopolysaccharide transport system ATP-binding protein
MEQEAVIRCEKIGVFFNRSHAVTRGLPKQFWALREVSMEVRRGETLGIIGSNGSGKSTLLKVLAGILRPDEGVITRDPAARASLLSVQAGFQPMLSGYQNAMLSGMLLGLSRREIQARIPEIFELAELEDFRNDPVYTYSDGMRARLGFCTAYFVNSDIIMLDEILGVGDAKFQQKATRMIHDLTHSGRTVALVSHSEFKVKELCTRIVWMDQGRMKMEGPPNVVWARYRPPPPKPPPRPAPAGAPPPQARPPAAPAPGAPPPPATP